MLRCSNAPEYLHKLSPVVAAMSTTSNLKKKMKRTKVVLPSQSTVKAAKAVVVEDAAKKFAVNAEMRVTKRGPKFSNEEDTALCRAYVNVSQDSTTGNNQKQDVFWT